MLEIRVTSGNFSRLVPSLIDPCPVNKVRETTVVFSMVFIGAIRYWRKVS